MADHGRCEPLAEFIFTPVSMPDVTFAHRSARAGSHCTREVALCWNVAYQSVSYTPFLLSCHSDIQGRIHRLTKRRHAASKSPYALLWRSLKSFWGRVSNFECDKLVVSQPRSSMGWRSLTHSACNLSRRFFNFTTGPKHRDISSAPVAARHICPLILFCICGII
jgi:hypothetical protein